MGNIGKISKDQLIESIKHALVMGLAIFAIAFMEHINPTDIFAITKAEFITALKAGVNAIYSMGYLAATPFLYNFVRTGKK